MIKHHQLLILILVMFCAACSGEHIVSEEVHPHKFAGPPQVKTPIINEASYLSEVGLNLHVECDGNCQTGYRVIFQISATDVTKQFVEYAQIWITPNSESEIDSKAIMVDYVIDSGEIPTRFIIPVGYDFVLGLNVITGDGEQVHLVNILGDVWSE